MTLTQARATLRLRGMTIRKRDDEYRVNFYRGEETTAYYTNDLDDAVDTGVAMRDHQQRSAE